MGYGCSAFSFYRNRYDPSLPWYQDPDVCKQADNRDEPYTLEFLHYMYGFRSTHGGCFYIEYRGVLAGRYLLKYPAVSVNKPQTMSGLSWTIRCLRLICCI